MAPRTGASRARWVVCLVVATASAAPARGEELALGMCAAFTGPAKELALQLRAGLEVAFAAANEGGGVRGRKVRLVSVDDRDDPVRAQGALAELADRHQVRALLGSGGPSTAEVLAAFANGRRLPLVGSLSPSSALRNDPPDRYVFHYRPGFGDEAAALLHHLLEVRRLPPSRIAVFAEAGPAGDALFQAVARAVRRQRRDPRGLLRVGYRRNTAEVDEAVRAIRRSGGRVRAVVVAGAYLPAARFIEKLRDARVDLLFGVSSLVGSTELAEELTQLGPTYARGILMTQVVPDPSSSAAAVQQYRDQLKRFAPGERPGFLSLEGWLLGRLLLEALGRAAEPLSSEALVEALESLRDLDLGTGAALGFAPSVHQASRWIWGTALDGRGGFSAVSLE